MGEELSNWRISIGNQNTIKMKRKIVALTCKIIQVDDSDSGMMQSSKNEEKSIILTKDQKATRINTK